MKRLLILAFVLAACGGAVESGTSTPTATVTAAPTPSPVYDHLADLQVGQCFDPLRDKDDQIILAASLKPCDEPHLAEITGQRVLPGAAGKPYPGGEQVADASERECLDAFSEYVGIEYDLSRLQAEYSFPGTETWPGGDRQVTCFVTGTEIGPLTRSVKGSSQ